MALHIRNQHIRAQPQQQHVRKNQTAMEKFQHMFSSQMQRIRSSPKQMIGWILGFIFMVILVLVTLHYFRLYSFPFLSFIPQKPAPASHLQYFFF
jgi:multidrug efflux pump subunit AcrB